MIACTKCGRLHADVEAFLGERLSCTQINQFWSRIKNEHKEKYGHLPHITMDETEHWICYKCNRRLF